MNPPIFNSKIGVHKHLLHSVFTMTLIKFGYSEKATKFEKIFHLKFDATQILWPFQNIQT